jgi:hypothetical protein
MSIEVQDKTILNNPTFDRMVQASKGQLRWTAPRKTEPHTKPSSELVAAHG